jgi:hypothetical protein
MFCQTLINWEHKMYVQSKYATLAAFLLALLTLFAAADAFALRSTKQESFTDPDYLEYQPKVVAILVLSDNLEVRTIIQERLAKDLEKRGIKVFFHEKLFPPTRDWDDAQRAEIYEKYSIEAGIVVGVGESSQDIRQYGSQTWGSANATAYGNSATAYGSSTTTALVSATSNASFSGVMVDLSENRIAWTSDIYTKASGTLIVGAKGDAKAAAKGIINGLIENNHIPKK